MSQPHKGKSISPRMNRDLSQKGKGSMIVQGSRQSAGLSPNRPRRQSSKALESGHSEQQEAAVLQLTDSQLEAIYAWVDQVPQSRPKKNIMRDFSDGSQIAHVIRHYLTGQYKGMVHVHNYVETSSKSVKLENWTMLNQRVLAKLGMHLSKEEMIGVANC